MAFFKLCIIKIRQNELHEERYRNIFSKFMLFFALVVSHCTTRGQTTDCYIITICSIFRSHVFKVCILQEAARLTHVAIFLTHLFESNHYYSNLVLRIFLPGPYGATVWRENISKPCWFHLQPRALWTFISILVVVPPCIDVAFRKTLR